MIKVVFVLYRNPELTHEQCLAAWHGERHVSLTKKIPGLVKWTQNHVSSPAEGQPDAVGELWFESKEAQERAFESSEMAAANEDAASFADFGRTFALFVDEKVVIE